MATNKSLAALLRSLQTDADSEDLSRLFGSATSLLTLLSNPLNVSLLTSQLLSASSIWRHPDGLQTTLRVSRIFISAARRVAQFKDTSNKPPVHPPQTALSLEEWTTAVIKGADERSAWRWRHLCVLTGLLIGFEGSGRPFLPSHLRQAIESAIAKATNLSLRDGEADNKLAVNSVAMLLCQSFEFLSDYHKAQLDNDALLPVLYRSIFFAEDGLNSGYFLSMVDTDLMQVTPSKFDWSPQSSSFLYLQRLRNAPLLASIGSISRLAAFPIDHVRDWSVLLRMMEDLVTFTRSLVVQWRQNKLSEIDVAEEREFLTPQSYNNTLPVLWQLLSSSLFSTIVILKPLLGRILADRSLPTEKAPVLATSTLHILRNLFFVSSHFGPNSSSQYQFVFYTAMDILSGYPLLVDTFLRDIQPTTGSQVAIHPLDRNNDLFFLNTAEHFALVLSQEACENLLVSSAQPYLGIGSDPRLLETFEAAHSVMLSVFTAPQNVDLFLRLVHPYMNSLFQVFPSAISTRQFRMAIKTMVRASSPPSEVAMLDPLLASTILELVRFRMENASIVPVRQQNDADPVVRPAAFSEKSTCQLAIIDSLPLLPVQQLEEWLLIAAEALATIQDPIQLEACRQRFWEVLSNGEMDLDKAALCVAWWGTNGGREMVMGAHPPSQEGTMMSGALVDDSRL